MPGRRHRTPRYLLALVAILLAASLLAAPADGSHGSPRFYAADAPEGVSLMTVSADGDDRLWPYTSRRPSFDGATLPINVVVSNDPEFVRFMLARSSSAEWNVTSVTDSANRTATEAANESATNATEASTVESGVVLNGTHLEWADARGSSRYTYLYNVTAGEGRWVGEAYQLHHGTYLGARQHVRIYEGDPGKHSWTAIQAHREHWDWFRLRHTVDSVDRSQDYIEAEFRRSSMRHHIQRTWYANGGAIDSDGWVTVIDLGVGDLQPALLSALLALSGLVGAMSFDVNVPRLRARLEGVVESSIPDPRFLLLVSSLSVLVLGVRVGAIAVETSVTGLSPKVIAAVFYPLLVFGTPTCAVLIARGLDPGQSSLAAVVGFGSGIVADYLYLDIALIPVGVLIHRAALVSAIALLAAGAASGPVVGDRDGRTSVNGVVAVGVLAWVVALLLPLLDLV